MRAKKPKAEKVRRGRSRGTLYTYEDGRQVFVVDRKLADIQRHGENNISNAIRAGVASWPIEDDFLIRMRARGVKFVGVRVRETKELYLTAIERFFEPGRTRMVSRFYGTAARALPLSDFLRRGSEIRM